MILVLPAGDVSAIGNNADYTIPNINLSLDPKGVYEASLIDCSFPNPGSTNNSVFISVDFLDNQLIGNNYFPILYKTQPMTQPVDSNEDSTKIHYEKELGSIQQWRRLTKTFIDNIRVRIYQSDGTNIPAHNANLPGGGGQYNSYSIVQLIIRQVA